MDLEKMEKVLNALYNLISLQAEQLLENEIVDDFEEILGDLDYELSKDTYCEKNPNARYNECNEEE